MEHNNRNSLPLWTEREGRIGMGWWLDCLFIHLLLIYQFIRNYPNFNSWKKQDLVSRKAVLNTAAIGMKSSSIVSKAGKGFFRIRKFWVQTLIWPLKTPICGKKLLQLSESPFPHLSNRHDFLSVCRIQMLSYKPGTPELGHLCSYEYK